MKWPSCEELKRIARHAAGDGLTSGQRAAALIAAQAAGEGLEHAVITVSKALKGEPSCLRRLQTFSSANNRTELWHDLESTPGVSGLYPELQQLQDLVAASDAAERALQTQLARVAKLLFGTTRKEVPR